MTLKGRLISALIVSLLAHCVFLALTWETQRGLGRGKQPLLVRITATESSPQLTGLPAIPPSADNKTALPVVGKRYMEYGELTEQPSLLDELPEVAKEARQDGEDDSSADLRLIIGADGRVLYLEVVRSTLSPALEEQVVRAFYHANYRPGRVGNRTVSAEMLVTVKLE